MGTLVFNHLSPSSHEWQTRQSNSSGFRILNRGSCCTPKFSLLFLKAFPKMIIKIQACTSTIGFFSIKLKRKLLKKGKIDKNNIFDKLEKNKPSSIHLFRLAFWPLSMQAWLASFHWAWASGVLALVHKEGASCMQPLIAI